MGQGRGAGTSLLRKTKIFQRIDPVMPSRRLAVRFALQRFFQRPSNLLKFFIANMYRTVYHLTCRSDWETIWQQSPPISIYGTQRAKEEANINNGAERTYRHRETCSELDSRVHRTFQSLSVACESRIRQGCAFDSNLAVAPKPHRASTPAVELRIARGISAPRSRSFVA